MVRAKIKPGKVAATGTEGKKATASEHLKSAQSKVNGEKKMLCGASRGELMK